MFTRRRWFVIFLLFLAGVINYMDRSALSIAAPVLSKDLHLTPAALGIIFSSFFAGYALFNFVGGYASDRLGPARVFSLAMAVWSSFCALTAATTGFLSLLIVRVLFGIGEGPFSSTANKLVNNWFPRREAASAVGIANGGTPLGGAISGPIVGLLIIAFSWRVSFVAIGIIGLIWLAFWMALVSDRPETDPRISEAERRELLEDHRCAEPGSTTPRGATVPLGHYLTQPTVLATAFAFFGYNYILFFFLSWFPSYLTTAQHLSLQRMSIVTVIPWVLGFLGLVSGGFISDFVYRRTGKALFSRKLVLVACLGGAAVCIALSGLVTGVTSAVALTAVAIFLLYLTGAIYWAIIQDIVVGENVGGVGGFMHGLANTSGIIGPAVTGFIVQWTGAFTSAFVLAGAIAILGVIGVIVFVHPIRQLGPHPAGQVPVA